MLEQTQTVQNSSEWTFFLDDYLMTDYLTNEKEKGKNMSPRTPEQFAKMREKSRKQLIEKALEIFAENGYYNTSIEKIAKSAGVSKGLIYNYFKSKDELLESIFMEGFKFFDDMTQINQNEVTPHQKLEILLNNFIASMQENLSFWKLYQNIVSQPHVSPKLTKFKEYYESVFGPLLMGIFTELFGNEMSEMEIQIEVMLFAAFLDGIAFDFTVMGTDYPLEAISQRLLEKY
jgi:AcrR family transcriptional regulator